MARDSQLTGWSDVKTDLRQSLNGWAKAPLLPIISILLAESLCLPLSNWIWMPAAILAAGWVGTQRVWYLRIFRKQSMSLTQVWPLTRAFIWRFARLGLLLTVAYLPFYGIAYAQADGEADKIHDAFHSGPMTIALVGMGLLT